MTSCSCKPTGFVHDGTLGAGSIAAGLDFDELGHHFAPSALHIALIRGCQIRLGNLQIQHRLAFRVVPGLDDPLGVILVGGAETGALAGPGVHTVVSSTTGSPANETATCLHSFHATAKINEAESEEVADGGRITPDYAGFLQIGKLVSVWTPQPHKPFLHK